jgi:LysM repeat protein
MVVGNGIKTKLKISPCDVKDGVATVNGEPPFEAMINPSGYSVASAIEYAQNKTLGPGIEKKFSKSIADKVTFKELVLDGTGIVGGPAITSVKDQIALLRKVSYNYQGSDHEPPVVEISWGPLLFKARVESLNIDYTLFKPNGDPLRAKIKLGLVAYKSTEESLREASLESPDLTHLVEVKAGDTLPLLCYQIYKNPAHYMAVARINNLQQFRKLQPGQVLRFPPLV